MSKITKTTEAASHIAVFQETAIRRTWHAEEWWFSIIDVVSVLSESNNPNRYWSDLKRKLAQEAGSGQPYEKIVRLKLAAPDGKQRDTDCANTETLFRIILCSPQSQPYLLIQQAGFFEKLGEENVAKDLDAALRRARELLKEQTV